MIQSITIASYAELASEYYDPHRHPTCANFREGSRALLSPWLRESYGAELLLVEVGAGMSLCAEMMQDDRKALGELILVDSSLAMLEYSSCWKSAGARLTQGDAAALPLRSGCAGTLVSSLGDPYNSGEFWQEVSRVLGVGGTAMFTTPSYEWAAPFRSDGDFASAEFELADRRTVRVPSQVLSEWEQVQLIRGQGLTIRNIAHFRRSELRASTVSRKLEAIAGDIPVVTAYRCVRDR